MKSSPSCQTFCFFLLLTWASVGCVSTASPEPAHVPTPLANTPALVTDLFLDASAPANITPDPLVLRARSVMLNSELLNGIGGPPGSPTSTNTLHLNLFPDANWTALPDRVEPNPNGFTWFGRAQGVDQSKITLVLNNGVMAGTIRAAGRFYQIRFISGTTYAIQEINPKAFPPD